MIIGWLVPPFMDPIWLFRQARRLLDGEDIAPVRMASMARQRASGRGMCWFGVGRWGWKNWGKTIEAKLMQKDYSTNCGWWIWYFAAWGSWGSKGSYPYQLTVFFWVWFRAAFCGSTKGFLTSWPFIWSGWRLEQADSGPQALCTLVLQSWDRSSFDLLRGMVHRCPATMRQRKSVTFVGYEPISRIVWTPTDSVPVSDF